jgi:hypothetical protein
MAGVVGAIVVVVMMTEVAIRGAGRITRSGAFCAGRYCGRRSMVGVVVVVVVLVVVGNGGGGVIAVAVVRVGSLKEGLFEGELLVLLLLIRVVVVGRGR